MKPTLLLLLVPLVACPVLLAAAPAPDAAAVYVADTYANRIAVFPLAATGNTPPLRTLAGPRTGLKTVTDIATDPAGTVYAANSHYLQAPSSVRVFAPGASGDVPPVRVIEGPRTGLTQDTLLSAIALAPDGTVYVSTVFPGPSVLAFAPGATGDAPPRRVLRGPRTQLRAPEGLALDPAGNLLVADRNQSSVLVFPPGASGDVPPSRSLRFSPDHAESGLAAAVAVATDRTGRLYVASGGNTFSVFPPGASGPAAPERTVRGSETRLHAPTDIALDSAGRVYVTNCAGNRITVYAPDARGNARPLRTVEGPATGLRCPSGLAVRR